MAIREFLLLIIFTSCILPPPPPPHSRVIKSPVEIDIIRYANEISSIAHLEVS